jgi:hypothetical protein
VTGTAGVIPPKPIWIEILFWILSKFRKRGKNKLREKFTCKSALVPDIPMKIEDKGKGWL